MNPIILPLPYFGNVLFYQTLMNQSCVIDIHENYLKQSYRNRCEILTVQDKLNLSVPIQKVSGEKMIMNTVQIDNTENWQKDHHRAVISAYGSAPFFEFYIDDLQDIWTKEHLSLVDLNRDSHNIICKILEWDLPLNFSEKYMQTADNDYRPYFSKSGSKSSITAELIANLKPYTQVFKSKNEYLPNLSILDLIFNLGPESNSYLIKTKN